MTQEQEFNVLDYKDVYQTAQKMHDNGYRMVQICGITKEGATEVLYSYDKDHFLKNFKVTVPFGTPVKSITPIYWAAFVYENEVHDLFDVEFTDSKLDYKGNFFKVSSKAPWKGPEGKQEGA